MAQDPTAAPPQEKLLESGAITIENLQAIALRARQDEGDLVDALLESGAVTHDALLCAWAAVHDLPSVNLETIAGDPLTLSLLPKDEAMRLEAMPLFMVENKLSVAVADPENLAKLDKLRFITGKLIQPVVALGPQILEQLRLAYGAPELDRLEDLEFELPQDEKEGGAAHSLHHDEDQRPIVRLVNLIFVRAIQDHATDIHLEPEEDRLNVRFRLDGCLQMLPYRIPPSVAPAIVSRIKILSRLDIAEQRRPQDGKIRLHFGGRKIDIRTSTFPSIHGEKVVLRILDQERTNFNLDRTGMVPSMRERWQTLLKCREGILLVTGPTGSGKTSTLFASLRHLVNPEINIVSLEDPVEYQVRGVTQGQVNEKAGFDFAGGLRSILRQDPDVILVGEIRDAETAAIATRAALTGHLVLASLHTNDAPSAIPRLIDLGVPPYLVSASLLGVLAQRLVRRLCPHCRSDVNLSEDEVAYLGPWAERLFTPLREGTGCKQCARGYKGRTGVHELVVATPRVRDLISANAPLAAIREVATAEGYRQMWWDGLDKVEAGATSLRELARCVERAPLPSQEGTRPTQTEDVAAVSELGRVSRFAGAG